MSSIQSIPDYLKVHTRTPALVTCDPRGLAVRTVGYYRRDASTSARSSVSAQWYDQAQRPIAQWDPRQFQHFQAGVSDTPNQTTVFTLSGRPVQQRNVDSGHKVMLHDALGLPRSTWDSQGTCTTTQYDSLMRLDAVVKRDAAGQSRTVQRITYSPVDATEAALNRCAAISRQDDDAGSFLVHAYAQLGGVLHSTRHFLIDDRLPDWPEAAAARDALLEPGVGYASRTQHDAMGSATGTTDAMGNVQHWRMDIAGGEYHSRLITATQVEHTLLQDVESDATGHVITQTLGNGVVSHAEYTPEDDRLIRLRSIRANGSVVQDLSYEYDPVGNILSISDAVEPTRYFANQRTEPVNRYTYDSFSQLIQASGREAVNAASQGPGLPSVQPLPSDPTLLINYTQHFNYDEAGNLLELRHVNGQRNYTRRMAVARLSNRSLPERDGQLPTEAELATAFDANGNLHQLQPGQRLAWDLDNQLQRVTPVVREDGEDDYERYGYDASGARVRKTASAQLRNGCRISDVRYLAGLEVRTDSSTGEELHVITAQAGYSTVRLLHWQAGKPQQIDNDQLRFGLDNHLGSCTLELDATAQLLSREEYYPFGGTSCIAGRNSLEAKYKTLRYSGKERDASGLYYYGLRYYAPWLQRWINPDPSGDVDGLNLYRMVGNNPINLIDPDGGQGDETPRKKLGLRDSFRREVLRSVGSMNINLAQGPGARREAAQRLARDEERTLAQAQMERKLALLQSMFELTTSATHTSDVAIESMDDMAEFGKVAAFRIGAIVVSNLASTAAGLGAGALALGTTGPAAPFIAMAAGKAASVAAEKGMEKLGMPTTLNLKSGALNPSSIKHSAMYKKHGVGGSILAKFRGFVPDDKKNQTNLALETVKTGGGMIIKKVLGSAEGAFGFKIFIDMGKAAVEANSVINGKSQEKMEKVERNAVDLIQDLVNRTQEVVIGMAPNGFDSDGVLHRGLFSNVTVGGLSEQLGMAIDEIENTRSAARAYRESHQRTTFYA
ncbi:RHS repeat-associated core domain-containing protein [Pseudomonas sp. PS01301]|uniref:RHS repeat domain-containing protein n=1 Tax=Pseudomonas sp. PS01301 TaxID=2991437 RepID=UPI00249BE782|nr:RHS repeat-associated core domain-containing protein [Pseudomonas sp. PS01301]